MSTLVLGSKNSIKPTNTQYKENEMEYKQIAVQEAIRDGKKVWVPADPKLHQIPTLISIPTTEDETRLLR